MKKERKILYTYGGKIRIFEAFMTFWQYYILAAFV
jgi:hypothetical protein